MATTLESELVGATLVMVQNSQPIADAEFDAFLKMVRNGNQTGVLVWAPKTGPTSAQRAKGRQALQGREKRAIAFVTGSSLARGAVAMTNVFVSDQIRTFAPDEFEAALKHARVASEDLAGVAEAIARLRALVGP